MCVRAWWCEGGYLVNGTVPERKEHEKLEAGPNCRWVVLKVLQKFGEQEPQSSVEEVSTSEFLFLLMKNKNLLSSPQRSKFKSWICFLI